MTGWVLHTGALTAFARGSAYMAALLAVSVEHDRILLVPTGALAAAWACTDPGDRYRLDYLMALDVVVVEPLDQDTARAVGELLAKAGVTDVVAAHCVHVALSRDWVVLTDDAGPLRALDAGVRVEEVP